MALRAPLHIFLANPRFMRSILSEKSHPNIIIRGSTSESGIFFSTCDYFYTQEISLEKKILFVFFSFLVPCWVVLLSRWKARQPFGCLSRPLLLAQIVLISIRQKKVGVVVIPPSTKEEKLDATISHFDSPWTCKKNFWTADLLVISSKISKSTILKLHFFEQLAHFHELYWILTFTFFVIWECCFRFYYITKSRQLSRGFTILQLFLVVGIRRIRRVKAITIFNLQLINR